MNKIYARFYKQKLFTLKEAIKIIRKPQVCKNTLNRLINKQMIKRLRNTIYHIVPLDNPDFFPDPIQIAMNLREDAIISCNSALIAYKLKEPEDITYITSKYASKIHIKSHTFKIIKAHNDIGIKKMEYDTGYENIQLKITDIERTILDCLWNKTIKIQELIQILRTKKIELSMKTMMKYLERYKKPILYNKAGFVLEAAKHNLQIQDEELDIIRKKLTKKTFQLKEKGLSLIRPRYKYYQKWNIFITEQLLEVVQPKPIL